MVLLFPLPFVIASHSLPCPLLRPSLLLRLPCLTPFSYAPPSVLTALSYAPHSSYAFPALRRAPYAPPSVLTPCAFPALRSARICIVFKRPAKGSEWHSQVYKNEATTQLFGKITVSHCVELFCKDFRQENRKAQPFGFFISGLFAELLLQIYSVWQPALSYTTRFLCYAPLLLLTLLSYSLAPVAQALLVHLCKESVEQRQERPVTLRHQLHMTRCDKVPDNILQAACIDQ